MVFSMVLKIFSDRIAVVTLTVDEKFSYNNRIICDI